MIIMTYTFIKHDSLNDGSAIDLSGRVATFDFNNFVKGPDVPSKDVGSDWNFRLAEVDYVGHANQTWVIEGYIPSGVTLNDAGSMLAPFQVLGSYCTYGSPIIFYDPEFILNPSGSSWVMPQSFKVEKDEGRSGRRYNLKLIETKQW